MKSDFFNGLNKEQKAAVKHISGPVIILAGAGSGKTKVLIHKVFNLVENHNVNSNSVAMITFTNKAAAEMKKRYLKGKLGYVGTFHSLCAKILREDGEFLNLRKHFIIYDDNDQQTLIKSIIKELSVKRYTPAYFLNRISAAKNQLITSDRYLNVFQDYNSTQVYVVYKEYEKRLNKIHAVDFDDLILKTTQLFVKYPQVLEKYQDQYRYIFIDEFQDTNYAQYVLTRLLGEKYKNVTVVGDFSQSIYSWRGADIRNLEKFQQDFPETKTFYLEQNYRSTQNILDFAHKIIEKNQTHPILQLHTNNHKGEDVIFYQASNEEDESLYIISEIERLKEQYDYNELAVLYRINAQSRAIEESLLHYSIPYVLIGGTRFYERKEIKDVLSYLRLLVNPADEVSKERIIKLGKKRWDNFKNNYARIKANTKQQTVNETIEEILKVTNYLALYNLDDEEDYSRLENIKELRSVAETHSQLYQFLEQVALVESEYFAGEKKYHKDQGVRLMTLHQAKGLEFPVVFIVGVEDGILPHSRSIDDYFQLEEERRLFYVGITRAKQKLYITYTNQRYLFGRRETVMKSRFLLEENEML